jgi:cytochrome c-type biogenesis protein
MPDVSSLALSGPLLLAVVVAALAGLMSFLSPCILPLVPGYLSYMTGMAGADLDAALNRPTARARGRILAGTLGFIAGFTVIFVLTSVLAASLGRALLQHARWVQLGAGLLIIVLGLAFLGAVPGLQREWRLHKLPSAGLATAPVLGAVFAMSWMPCLSPTLVAVVSLATVDATASRAVVLAVAYCLGLGLPFLIFGLAFRKLIGVHRAVRRHSRWVTRIGGGLLVAVGIALATGLWSEFLIWLRVAVGPVSVPL